MTRMGTAATANCHGISSNGVPAHRCARMCTVVEAFAIAATRSIPMPISRSRSLQSSAHGSINSTTPAEPSAKPATRSDVSRSWRNTTASGTVHRLAV